MTEKRSLGPLPPLFFGRLGRILLGLAALGAVPFVDASGLGLIGMIGLVFLGVSFVIGGLTRNPGCEITALPNLALPPGKRLHCL